MPADTTTSRGSAAEDAALGWLEEQGLRLVERNFRCKMGEIDLIMVDDKTLAFIEVRLRNNSRHLTGAESVTRGKIQRLIRTARFYLQGHPQPRDVDFRFDVVSMGPHIEWITNAFTLDR